MTFQGFPEAALDFYDDLEIDNTKSFWEAHKDVYKSAVAEPMKTLLAELEDEFGAAKIFRPYRDVRFAKDKSPYKTHQGAYVATGPSTGYYVQVGAAGVMVGAGFYEATPARLAVIREAMADEAHGGELEGILSGLETDGWKVGGETLKTAPRGWDVDHPRIELLRHKSLTVGREYGFDKVIHSAALVTRIRDDWRTATPFLGWVTAHGTP
jgi:uncharacterized protein (TIGR02453 family)